MNKKNIIIHLVILNLLAILIILLSKIEIVTRFISIVFSIMITPIIFGVFLFYILKPVNDIFIRKKIKHGRAAFLTIIIFLFLSFGVIIYFGDYFIEQFINIKNIMLNIINENSNNYIIQETIKENILNFNYYNKVLGEINSYIGVVVGSLKNIFDKGMQMFSNILLIFIILFYLLKDEEEIKEKIVKIFPKKYKNKISNIVEEGDDILSSYVIGQAKVAISLATMMFIGYKIIGIPSSLLFASATFILAFIPFVGFFISLILPYIIAIALGMNMILKLTILVVIAQTLKGRIIVPFIMGKTMKIHPITDIFLVIGAATLVGPIGAFVVVPLYYLLRIIIKYFDEEIHKKVKEFKE